MRTEHMAEGNSIEAETSLKSFERVLSDLAWYRIELSLSIEGFEVYMRCRDVREDWVVNYISQITTAFFNISNQLDDFIDFFDRNGSEYYYLCVKHPQLYNQLVFIASLHSKSSTWNTCELHHVITAVCIEKYQGCGVPLKIQQSLKWVGEGYYRCVEKSHIFMEKFTKHMQ